MATHLVALLFADNISLLYDIVATNLMAVLLADKISLPNDTVARH